MQYLKVNSPVHSTKLHEQVNAEQRMRILYHPEVLLLQVCTVPIKESGCISQYSD
jgi:hypothetical protein